MFETDAKNLVQACKNQQEDSYFHTIVGDCLELQKHFMCVLIEWFSVQRIMWHSC